MKGGGKHNLRATTCFNCGGVGHRAAQRPTSVREVEHEEEEDGGHGDVVSVSEGWDIFGLEEGTRLQCCQRWRGCPRRRRRLLAGFSPLLHCQVARRRRPEDQIRPMDAAHWAGSDTQQSFGGDAGRGERPASGRLLQAAEQQSRSVRGTRRPSFPPRLRADGALRREDGVSALAPVARVTDFRNMVQFGPTDEDNYIFCPKKDRKFVFCRELRRAGVGFQRPGLSGPTQVPPASTVSRVGKQCAHKDVRVNEERIDVLGVVETRSTRERWSLGRGERQTSTKKRRKKNRRGSTRAKKVEGYEEHWRYRVTQQDRTLRSTA